MRVAFKLYSAANSVVDYPLLAVVKDISIEMDEREIASSL